MPAEAMKGAFRMFVGDSEDDSDFLSDSSEYTDEDDVPMDIGTMTETPARLCCVYGEVFVKYAQDGEKLGLFRRSIEGPEIQLGFSLYAEGGHYVEFFSVIPKGPLGDQAVAYLKDNGLKLRLFRTEDLGGISDLTEMIDTDNGVKISEFQRIGSAFHRASKPFKWEKGILHDRAPCWVHSSVSSFVWSDTGKENWIQFMEAGTDIRLPPGDVQVSLELGSKQWPVSQTVPNVMAFIQPYLPRIALLVLTLEEFTILGAGAVMTSKKQFETSLNTVRAATNCTAVAVLAERQSSIVVVLVHKEAGLVWSKPQNLSNERQVLGRLLTAFIRKPTVKTQDDLEKLINDVCEPANSNFPVPDNLSTPTRLAT